MHLYQVVETFLHLLRIAQPSVTLESGVQLIEQVFKQIHRSEHKHCGHYEKQIGSSDTRQSLCNPENVRTRHANKSTARGLIEERREDWHYGLLFVRQPIEDNRIANKSDAHSANRYKQNLVNELVVIGPFQQNLIVPGRRASNETGIDPINGTLKFHHSVQVFGIKDECEDFNNALNNIKRSTNSLTRRTHAFLSTHLNAKTHGTYRIQCILKVVRPNRIRNPNYSQHNIQRKNNSIRAYPEVRIQNI